MTNKTPAAISVVPSPTAMALARLAHSVPVGQLPEETTRHALKIVRDTFGVMLAGSSLPEVRDLADLAPMLGAGSATIVGRSETAVSHVAALVNGAGGVSLELDEGNQYAINHPAIHMLPALWALAEEESISGAQLLHAFVVGYELSVRVGRATRLRASVHPFGTYAIVGTAIGAALLLSLDIAQTAKAIELAAGMTIASSQSAANTGASVRNLFTGLTNHNGLLAARLARTGFCGEPGSLDAVFGNVLGDRFILDIDSEFQEYFILKNYFKIYACSRWNHAPIEAIARVMSDNNVTLNKIAAVDVFTFDPATRLSGKTVSNGYAAKHSIPYNVAAQMVYRVNTVDVYTDHHVQDPRVQDMLQKITVHEDPDLTALLPEIRAAWVRVTLATGEHYTARSDMPKGGYDNPLSEKELQDKFRLLALMVLDDAQVNALDQAIAGLATAVDLRQISLLLKGRQDTEGFDTA